MTRTTMTATAALALALGLAAAAPAQAAGDGMQHVDAEVCDTAFAKFDVMGGHVDSDHDSISASEANANDFPEEAFEKLDRDGDQKVSRAEFRDCGTVQAEMEQGGWDIIAFVETDGADAPSAAESAERARDAAERAAEAAENAEQAAERTQRIVNTAQSR